MTTTQSADSTARDDSGTDILARLREREVTLLAHAQELQARAAHLMRVRNAHQNRLARKVDAHQKIILGALVQKAGLDWVLVGSQHSHRQNDDVSDTLASRLDDISLPYDRERILAALMWLAEVSKRQPNDVVSVPDWSLSTEPTTSTSQ
ncbi:conjugal transfer protein TraD [Acidovorax temperans]|uniref:conjugal transfer protein TraD n=1 Tax=Acidovorax temperans TaxID=80878 RepID=UPI00289DF37D|nr:conjugal transfer protein TraD [Acidovorax temperans]